MDTSWGDFATLMGVVWVDIALAADNAIAVGLAASALPAAQRRRVVAIGVAMALGLRIVFALMVGALVANKWFLIPAGLLLLWVAWRMVRDVYGHQSMEAGLEAAAEAGSSRAGKPASFWGALRTIVIADVTMSLDNVVAIGALASDRPAIMAFGLVLSVLLMGIAATFIAGLVQKHRWIALVGIVVIVLAAGGMIWEGVHAVSNGAIPAPPELIPTPH